MTFSDPFELTVEIISLDNSDENIEKITLQLMEELQGTEVESVSLLRGIKTPTGAKSTDIINWGTLLVTVAPTVLPKLIDVIQAWALRGQSKTVKFKGKIDGEVIEFEGSKEDLEKTINFLYKRKISQKKNNNKV